MGQQANVKKDRICKICGDIRLRTASEMRTHWDACVAELKVQARLEKIGLVRPGLGQL